MGDIVEGLSKLYGELKKGLSIEQRQAYLDLQEKALTVEEENHELKIRINELEKQLAIKEELFWDGIVYWLGEDKKDGPFCQRCWDVEGKAIRLQTGSDYWLCEACNTSYDRRGPGGSSSIRASGIPIDSMPPNY